ncbi:MAG: ABC transporter permease subunit [Ilumatobacteraceae bacterium]
MYLLFGLLLFGIRQTPAAVATVAFSVPPVIHIVAASIHATMPPASVEAGRIFGSSRWQLLWKVQFPQATRSFLTAVNQTVMMCLSMVVIGALIGAGGLGGELLQTLKLRSPGRGVVVGVAIFGIAFAFDRLGRSLIGARAVASRLRSRDYWLGAAAVLLVAYFVGRGIDHGQVPWTFARDVANPIDDLVEVDPRRVRSQPQARSATGSPSTWCSACATSCRSPSPGRC